MQMNLYLHLTYMTRLSGYVRDLKVVFRSPTGSLLDSYNMILNDFQGPAGSLLDFYNVYLILLRTCTRSKKWSLGALRDVS